MVWFWSDALARLLIDESLVEASVMSSWIERPIAVAAVDESEAREVALRLFGVEAVAEAS